MEKSRSRTIIKFLLLFCLIIVCWYAGQQYDIQLEEIQQKFQGYPLAVSGLIFVASYVILTNLIWFGPKDIFRTAAAILFGATISTAFVVIGEALNAVVLFHMSRFFGREFVESRLGQKKVNLEKMTRSRSMLGVFTARINILIPIRFTDLGYGLTNISFRKYALPAALALPPRVFLQQYFLASGGVAVIEAMSQVLSGEPDRAVLLFTGTTDNPLYSYYLENKLFWISFLCYILIIIILSFVVSSRKIMQLTGKKDVTDG